MIERSRYRKFHSAEKAELIVQAVATVMLVALLVGHLTEVGFVGLAIIIVITTCNGETEEHGVRRRSLYMHVALLVLSSQHHARSHANVYVHVCTSASYMHVHTAYVSVISTTYAIQIHDLQ